MNFLGVGSEIRFRIDEIEESQGTRPIPAVEKRSQKTAPVRQASHTTEVKIAEAASSNNEAGSHLVDIDYVESASFPKHRISEKQSAEHLLRVTTEIKSPLGIRGPFGHSH